MITRQLFTISTDTGTQGDTGPPFHGEVAQMRWNPTTADTGGDLAITLLPKTADTGDGFQFFNDNDCLGVNFNRVPVQQMHHEDGRDTGAAIDAPIVGAGDRLRVKVTPGGAALAGRLYVWIRSND